jgi:hypothetical protein
MHESSIRWSSHASVFLHSVNASGVDAEVNHFLALKGAVHLKVIDTNSSRKGTCIIRLFSAWKEETEIDPALCLELRQHVDGNSAYPSIGRRPCLHRISLKCHVLHPSATTSLAKHVFKKQATA